MEINADFSKAVLAHTDAIDWVSSPMVGVERRMLDRIGGEVARATSLVRYAEGSAFPEHTHGGGEEFIVLEGVFQDEYGDYPAGTYVRNPVGTHHIPRSDPGCTIFVKLWQFDREDREQFAIDLNTLLLEDDPMRPGVASATIAKRRYESVELERWNPGASDRLSGDGGVEALILSGTLLHDGAVYMRHDWIRLPEGKAVKLIAGDSGARMWIKRGHLNTITVPSRVT